MRRALLTAAAVVAGALVVPTAAATAAPAAPSGTQQYQDPAQSGRPTVSVDGTLVPIDSEDDDTPRYGVETADGTIVPVSLKLTHAVDGPRTFHGRIALDERSRRRTGVRPNARIAGDTTTGRDVLADVGTSTAPQAVATAEIGAAPVRATVTASAHRLYVAVITNRGTLDATSTVTAQLAAMRTYWQTESDGLISSFTEPSATVRYASSAAASTADGCGLADPTSVWNEAAAKFPGVDFSRAGNHLLVAVSADCSGSNGAGIGTVGSSLASGGRSIVSLGSAGVQIGVHELGHNLSLEHANAEHCATTCTTDYYRDLYSIMGLAISGGSWTPPALDTAYRVQEGIASATEVPTITASGTVHLAPRGTSDGIRGLVVTAPGTSTRFAVEYRSGTGRDSTAFYASGYSIGSYAYRPGVVVERLESDGSTTLMTRTSGSTYLTSYGAGETFTSGLMSIAVTAASPSSGADVTVGLDGTIPPTPPVATPVGFTAGTPTVLGRPQVGVRLVASPGRWLPSPTRFTYRWTADGAAVAGATAATFVPSAAQLGRRIAVQVTASRSGLVTTVRTSAPTAPVLAGRLTSGRPTVSGRAAVGRVLTARTGSWSPSPRFSYRWYAAGRPISRATGATLRITRALKGKRITVRVVGSRPGYASTARDSAQTSTVR